MREPRFLHVGITIVPDIDVAQLDEAIESESYDWMRYAFFSYVIWSSSDTETVCRKVLRVPGLARASVMVWAMDMSDGFAYLPPAFWDWIKKDRGKGPLATWTPLDPGPLLLDP